MRAGRRHSPRSPLTARLSQKSYDRGYYTGWLQTSPTLGIVVSLAVIIATRTYFGNEAFDAWAWRVPFLVSFLLVGIAI